ncbi:hypothetical protein BJ742DRAFT_799479 [Cladochytrium replicatum]|nr:hypothetical protein BJ742DRAFT_799479 [Cladochytrium replicatum]
MDNAILGFHQETIKPLPPLSEAEQLYRLKLLSSLGSSSLQHQQYQYPTPFVTPGSGSAFPGYAYSARSSVTASVQQQDSTHYVPPYPEVAYITDPNGIIISVEDKLWNQFIVQNLPPHSPLASQRADTCAYPSIVGRSLFEFMGEQKVASFFRHIVSMLLSGSQPRFTYHWFCDSPSLERKMSMTITTMSLPGLAAASGKIILWLSRILYEKPLPTPALYLGLDSVPSPPASSSSSSSAGMPKTRSVCSYCKRILVSRREISELASSFLANNNITTSPFPFLSPESIPIIGLRGKLGLHFDSPTIAEYFVSRAASGGDTSWPPTPSLGDLWSPDHVWLTPSQYYEVFDGGSDSIENVHHGICEMCYSEILTAFFPQWSVPDPAMRAELP